MLHNGGHDLLDIDGIQLQLAREGLRGLAARHVILSFQRGRVRRSSGLQVDEICSHHDTLLETQIWVYRHAIRSANQTGQEVTDMDINVNAIETALRRLPDLPTPVSSWRVETGPDSTDAAAVWVWAMLIDDEVEFTKRSRLRSIIRELVQEETDSSILVYVRFRGASEVAH